MSHDVFCHSYRVVYADCTVGNHVYYARYLEILEAARGEFFRSLGVTFLQWQERDTIFPVVECRLRYKSSARYDDNLTVEIWILEAVRARINFAYRIKNHHGAIVLEGETFHVCARLDEKPKRLPEELVQMLKPFLCATEIANQPPAHG